MDVFEIVLTAIESVPHGLCTCCLVERTGLRPHSYVRSICQQLRQDGKIRHVEIDIARALDHRRRPKTDRCGACGQYLPEEQIFTGLNPSAKSDEQQLKSTHSAIVWREDHLADMICKALPSSFSGECVSASWLNNERGNIIRILKRLEGSVASTEGLGRRISSAREKGLLPSRVANHMQTLMALRNTATYEDRRLDPAESLIARLAADEIGCWAAAPQSKRNASGKR